MPHVDLKVTAVQPKAFDLEAPLAIEVALLVYDRPDHTRRVLDSLSQNGVRSLRVFMDGAEDPAVRLRQEQMLQDLAARRELSVNLHRHTRRLGLANSVRFALHSVFEKADAAVILEDDCVVRPGGLAFFAEGLRALRYDRRVRSICGYLHPCPFIRAAAAPLLLKRFCPWGWATWRDRWCDYDNDLRRVVHRLKQRAELDELGRDLAELCRTEAYLENRVDIWSLNWILEHYATSTLCAYPCDSMIENIGLDGTGQNCVETTNFSTPVSSRTEWEFDRALHCLENDDILRQFMDENGLKTYPPGPRTR